MLSRECEKSLSSLIHMFKFNFYWQASISTGLLFPSLYLTFCYFFNILLTVIYVCIFGTIILFIYFNFILYWI